MIQYLYNFVLQLVQNQQTANWVVVLLVAVAVLFLCLALYLLFSGYFSPQKKRFYKIVGAAGNGKSRDGFLNKKFGIFGHLVAPSKNSNDSSDAVQRLKYAGYNSEEALSRYFGSKILLMLVLPALVYVGFRFVPSMQSTLGMVIVACFGVVGMLLPSFYLDKKVAKRQLQIRRGLPDMLDQLIVCTEAGLGFEAGLDRVRKEMSLSNEAIAEELTIMNGELRGGVDRETTLRNLYTRTGVEEVRFLVSSLCQSMRFGTSIAGTLRIAAEEMRDKRMQAAEEQAAKLAVTLLFPVALCFFPGIFIVLLGPAMLAISAGFKSMAG